MSASVWPWAALAPVAHRVDLWSMVSRLGGVAAAACASPEAWARAGLPAAALARLEGAPTPRVADATLPGVGLFPGHPAWPGTLDDQPYGAVWLSAEGDLGLLAAPAVAVVGARACTATGRRWSRRIAAEVAAAGGVVVSGLARGIDAEAHVAAGARTIAVLGQGLAAGQPLWQAQLRRRVLAAGGLVLSEMPADAPATPWSFPVRNRVIAGLARVVVVVEADHRSGARNTANHAVRLGREVYAVPGAPDAPASAGCLDLIEEGAAVLRDVGGVLQAAGLPARRPWSRVADPRGGGYVPTDGAPDR